MKDVKTSWLIIGGMAIIFAVPWILTNDWLLTCVTKWFPSYLMTGQIGDTIGGTTAPFMSLFGSILLFWALKEQIKANELVVRQFEQGQSKEDIAKLFGYWEKSIGTFSFSSLPYAILTPKETIRHDATSIQAKSAYFAAKGFQATTEVELIEYHIEKNQSDLNENASVTHGSEAIHQCLTQVVCQSHAPYDELYKISEIKQLISIFDVANELMDRIHEQESNGKPYVYRLLVYQLFRYHFAKDWFDKDLKKKQECPDCKHNHGLPNDLYDSYSKLQKNLNITPQPLNS